MDDDLKRLLREIYKTLRDHQKAIWQMQLLGTSLLGALRESNPTFESLYAKHFEEAKESPLARDNELVLQLLAQLIQRLGEDAGRLNSN